MGENFILSGSYYVLNFLPPFFVCNVSCEYFPYKSTACIIYGRTFFNVEDDRKVKTLMSTIFDDIITEVSADIIQSLLTGTHIIY